MAFSPIKKLLQDIKSGKMVVLMDDENRENEGDLICAAEMVTKESINFMAKFGKGLICLPLSNYYAEKLELAQMASHNTDNHETAFTISIDHLSTSTGISAEDRALTAKMVANDSSKAKDFRRPGHLFPLLAKEGGVLARNGHTEATVDLCRLAGLKECGLCCEIMAEDGSMMRKDELLAFAQKHDLAIATIKQLQDYRRQGWLEKLRFSYQRNSVILRLMDIAKLWQVRNMLPLLKGILVVVKMFYVVYTQNV